MWTVSLWFFIFLFAINGFFYYLDDVFVDYNLINPFTNQTMVLQEQPNIYSTFQTINDTSQTNATGGDIVNIWDSFNFGWNTTIFLYNMVTGGFVFGVLASIIPATGSTLIIFGLIQGTLAFFLIITAVHFLRAI